MQKIMFAMARMTKKAILHHPPNVPIVAKVLLLLLLCLVSEMPMLQEKIVVVKNVAKMVNAYAFVSKVPKLMGLVKLLLRVVTICIV